MVRRQGIFPVAARIFGIDPVPGAVGEGARRRRRAYPDQLAVTVTGKHFEGALDAIRTGSFVHCYSCIIARAIADSLDHQGRKALISVATYIHITTNAGRTLAYYSHSDESRALMKRFDDAAGFKSVGMFSQRYKVDADAVAELVAAAPYALTLTRREPDAYLTMLNGRGDGEGMLIR